MDNSWSVIAVIAGWLLTGLLVYIWKKIPPSHEIDHKTIGMDEEDDYYR